MDKNKFPILKQKITPKESGTEKSLNKDRFTIADNVLNPHENETKKQVVIRKTFSIPEDEVINFKKIKDRALDYRVVISDSEIIRIGLILTSNLTDNEFHERILNINKLITGRPKNL